MSIGKQFLKSKPVCKVTFNIPASVGGEFAEAHVVGEFNAWSTTGNPMKRLKNGSFRTTVDLETGRSYQFRYLLGPSHWENEPEADDQIPTPFGDSLNSVLDLSVSDPQ